MQGTTSWAVLRDAWTHNDVADSGPTVAAMRRAQRLWAPLITGTWLIGLIPASVTSAATGVLMAVTLAAWITTVIVRPSEMTWLAAILMTCSVGIMWLTDGGIGSQETPAAAAWFDAAAVAAGLGMATLRRSVMAVTVVGAVALLNWGAVALIGPLDGGWRTAVAWPTATWGGGLAVALGVAVIRRGAFRLDHIHTLADSATTDEEIAVAARARLARFARLMHDTVINTLGAVGQGLAPHSRKQLADRCRYDLMRLAAADPDAPDDLLVALHARARTLGLQLDVAGDPDLLRDLAGPVSSAVAVALGECLLNTAKHSGAKRATLRVTATPSAVRVTLADTGTGWSGGFADNGGIAESVVARCREVGIAVSIDTAPGRGTAVALRIPPPPPREERVAGLIQTEIVALGAVGCGAVAVDLGIRTMLTVGLYPALPGVAAFLILLSALGLAWRAALRPPGALLYAAWAALCLALAPIIPLLPDSAVGPLAWGWWATIATLPLFAALLLLNAPPLVLLAAYTVQTLARVLHDPEHPTDIVFPQVVAVAFTAVLLWGVRERIYTLVLRYEESVAALSQRRRRTLEALGAQRAGARQLQQVLEPGRDMLRRLADGTADSDDPAVRDWCRQEAHHLRSVSLLGPFLADTDIGLLPLLVAAHERGTSTRVNIDAAASLPAPPSRPLLAAVLAAAAADLPGRGTILLALLHSAAGSSLTLVADARPWSIPADIVHRGRGSGLAVTVSHEDGSSLLEIRWEPSEPSDPAEPSG